VQTSVLKQIVKLETAPELGELLGNKNGINLSGLRKLYAAKKQIRIIYEIVADEIVVHVIAIGKREEMEAYKEALKRIEKPVV
jgi:mRNA interferase RelE/StbE